MRIAHVTDAFAPDVGGIERQVQSLARRQREQGHDVTVITAVAERAPLDSELHVVRAARGRWLTVAFPWRNRRVVARTLDAGHFDIVHAHYSIVSPMAIYVSRAASRRGIPVAITVHSLWWKIAIATRLSLLPFGWGRLRASWSAVSSVAAGRVERTLRSVGDILVVPNLVETAWWQRPSHLPNESLQPTHLVLVGRLKRRKHIDEFLSALARARVRVPPATKVRVTIVGEGPRRADLEKQVVALELTDWVRLVGERDAMAIRELLHVADVCVVSSRHESFGVAALEARSAGLPVLGYLGTGLADFIEPGVDGLLVANSTEMTDMLVRLVRDRRLVDRLQANTRISAPSISASDALRAVDDLYRSAGCAIGVVRDPLTPTEVECRDGSDKDLPLSRRRGARFGGWARAAVTATRGWHWWRELILIAMFYEAYNFIQHLITGSTDRAMSNGRRILRAEQFLHFDPEHAMNHLVDKVTVLAVPACYVYTTLHFLVTPAVLIWAHYARPATYVRTRTVLMAMTLIALAGFLWFPTAPPRLLTGGGYVDTVTRFSNWGWWTSNSLPRGAHALENAYAAMPSLHVAWAVWSGGTVLAIARRRIVRVLAVVYPVLIAFVVTATANHYLADVVVGALLWPAGLGLAHLASRAHITARRLHRRRPSETAI